MKYRILALLPLLIVTANFLIHMTRVQSARELSKDERFEVLRKFKASGVSVLIYLVVLAAVVVVTE